MKNKNRLTILHDDDIETLYALPQFSKDIRMHYLALSQKEIAAMQKFGTITSKLYFALQLSYFKVKRQFFTFDYSEVIADADFILKTYLKSNKLPTSLPSKNTKTSIRRSILTLLKCNGNKKLIIFELQNLTDDICRTTVNPREISDKLLNNIEKNDILLPAHSVLQDIIGKAIKQEALRLEKILKKSMPNYIINDLKQLLMTTGYLHDVDH